jgi:hypothetical protein
MQFYTAEQINSKYSSKKSSCNKRNIKFEFTKEEFTSFCNYLNIDSECAYTGVQLVKDNGHKHQASIERIDSMKGYSIDNCVWTTKESNQLKGRFDDRNKQLKAAFTKSELKILEDILKCDVSIKLNNIYKFVKLQAEPVDELRPHSGQKEEHGMVGNKEQNQISDAKDTNENSNHINIYAVNDDVSLAVSYSQFAEHCKEHVDFYLSFNEYKKLMNRKKCQLTMQNFDEEHKRSLFVIDKTQPIVVANLLVVDLKLRHNLDSFIGKMKLTNKQLKSIFKNLGEVMKG